MQLLILYAIINKNIDRDTGQKLSGVEMKTYIVSFFGHRGFDSHIKYEDKVKEIIKRLLWENESVEFLVGRNGEFDKFAA